MNSMKQSNIQLLLSFFASIGFVISFPHGGIEILCLMLMLASLVWGLVLLYRHVLQHKYKTALLVLTLNALFIGFAIALWIRYDYAVNTKTLDFITNIEEANDFGVVTAQYKQVRIPIIDGVPIECNMYSEYESWHDNIKDKSHIAIDTAWVNHIITMQGCDVPLMFYFRNRKYNIMEGSAELTSMKKQTNGDLLYVIGCRQKKKNDYSVPDSMVFNICRYGNSEAIDSIVFECIKTNAHLSTNKLEATRTVSFAEKLKNFLFIDELREEVNPYDPLSKNWIQKLL